MGTKKVKITNDGDVVFEGKTVGQLMVEGLAELAGDFQAGIDLTEKYTCRQISLRPAEQVCTPERIIAARKILGASQSLFANFLGFSANTVRSWEQGTYEPQRVARLLIEYIHEDPTYWRKKFKARVVPKTPNALANRKRNRPGQSMAK